MAEQTYKLISGEEHPDNKPPVTLVAKVSDEQTKAIEDQVNAEIQASRLASGVQQAKQEASSGVDENLEDYTVAELKAMAEKKGVHISWDANKQDIIKAIKKAK